MFRLCLTGLPDAYWRQANLPEKLATLMDVCLTAERIGNEHPEVGEITDRALEGK